MRIDKLECRHCGCEVSYIPEANFFVFCPKCKREIYMECEYGYGPVAPCSFLLGQDILGTVTVNENNKYLLNITADNRQIKLEKTYLNALNEACEIIKNYLK